MIITGHGSMEMAIQALRMGAADFLTKPVKLLELDAVLEKAMRIRELRQDRRHLRETIGGIQASDDIRTRNRSLVGVSTKTKKLRAQIRQAVEAKCETILITGETGTGKEVVAREIHFQGSSDDRPFIAVSCPALLDSLVESELFGHVKGSFTGATGGQGGVFRTLRRWHTLPGRSCRSEQRHTGGAAPGPRNPNAQACGRCQRD